MATDYDVIVVGAGGAGLAAAQTAIEAGAKVLVVEAGAKVGGSTNLSGGHIYAAGTSVQRAAGIEGDTPQSVFQYYMQLNQFRLEPTVARRLCLDAPQVIEWLISLGIEFPVKDLYVSGVDGIRRGHIPAGNGAAIVTALDTAISGKCDVALKTRVRRLLVENGRVVGIGVDGNEIRAGAVVVTTGGFGNNPELLARYYPEAAAHGDWTWYIGAQHAQGDHLELGEQVGADVTGFNRGLVLATPGFRKELEVYMPSWLVYVNHEGRRFIDETMEYNILSGVLKEQLASECFAIFDEDARSTASPDPETLAAVKAGLMTTCWLPDVLDEMVRSKKLMKAATLEQLARLAGIRWPALQNTIDTYNKDAAQGRDTQFDKVALEWKQIKKPPFYAARMRAAVVCFTSMGLRIDADARVRDKDDNIIQGLYAAGESAGGVLGDRIMGGGSSMANVLVYGRAAGLTAARDALRVNAR